MIKSTFKQNHELAQNKRMDVKFAPSKLSMKFIMGYAAALHVTKSREIGEINLLLN